MAGSEVIPRPGEGDGDGDSIAAAVLNALNHPDRGVRARIVDEASRAADPELLLRAVRDHRDSVLRNAAMDALVRGGARSVPALVRALGDPDPELVIFAATMLSKTRDREVIPHLVRLLDHDDINVVQAAIESLGHQRASSVVPRLLALLDHDPWLRFGAVHALGEIGDPRAAEALGAALGDDDLRELAAVALGKVRSPQVIGHLSGALVSRVDSPDFLIVLRALGDALRRQPRPDLLAGIAPWARLGTRAAAPVHLRLGDVFERVCDRSGHEDVALVEAAAMLVRGLRLAPLYRPLIRAARSSALRSTLEFWVLSVGADIADAVRDSLRDRHSGVRTLACRCAGALGLSTLIEPLADRITDPTPAVREAAVRALMQLGADVAVSAFVEELLDPDPAVRLAAQEALTICDPETASAALLAYPRRDPTVAAAMLRLMRVNPHANQLPFLFDCLRQDDAEIRRLAVEALAEQAEIELVDLVAPILDDPDHEVRVTAIRVLGRKRTARATSLLVDLIDRSTTDVNLIVDTLLEMDGTSVAPRLVEVYQRHPDRDHLPILQALAEARELAVEPLVVGLLAEADHGLRRAAVEALGHLGSPVARRHVIAAGTDPAWEVRVAVAEVLGDMDHADATAELERLCFDEHVVVATAARHKLENQGAD